MKRTRSNYYSKKSQSGFTLVEISIVVVIGMVIILSALQGVNIIQDKRKVSSGVNQLTQIYQGAADWRATRASYAGISMAVLNNLSLLPNNIGAGVGVNPWGGNYTITANAANNGLVDIALTNVPAGVSAQMEDKIEPSTSGGNTSVVAGTTVTSTFE